MGYSNSVKPIYKNIALDVANKIVRGEIKENEKLSGRSLLASTYNVSPETIRRAISLLQQMNVVSVTQGSGIEVISVSAAEKFIEKLKDNEYIISIKDNIVELLEEHKRLDDKIKENFYKITDFIERFQNISPFTLIEIEINKDDATFITDLIKKNQSFIDLAKAQLLDEIEKLKD
jgi:DNA-binding GntR family transcriptional regulator